MPGIDLTQLRDINGDRVLVDKNVFGFRKPRRWEIAVFRCPDPKELNQAYVKRVIGLPGETIEIAGGEVYANGELLRKSIVEARESRLLEFDMSHAPTPGGWNERWLITPPEQDPRLPGSLPQEAIVADGSVLDGKMLILDAATTPQTEVTAEYRNWNLDTRREEAIRDWNSYDGIPKKFPGLPLTHDFFLVCRLEAIDLPSEGSFRLALTDGADQVIASVSVSRGNGGQIDISHHELKSQAETVGGGLTGASGFSLKPGKKYLLEFGFVDRRVTLAIDGRVLAAPADLPSIRLPNRPIPSEPRLSQGRTGVSRPLRLSARGCRVVVDELRLYRDVAYTQAGRHGTEIPAPLGPGEYFVLGDNSGNSEDSRFWPNPGVPERAFIGKPFFVHQPLRTGRMTVGGNERRFQTLDWSRFRILH